MTRFLALLVVLTYAASPLPALAHLEPPADCCGPDDDAALDCGDEGDCDSPGHHHHHHPLQCSTCSHSAVAMTSNGRTPVQPPLPVAAETCPDSFGCYAPDAVLPGSRAPPAARV